MITQEKPLLSIVLPVYNAETQLEAAVSSLLFQSYKNLEIIAIDDFSKDTSYKILKAFAKKDKRIRVFRNKKHYGLAVCYNRALRRAKGQMISFTDPRDVSKRERLQKQVKYLSTYPKIAAVGTQCAFYNKNNKKLGESSYPLENEEISKQLLIGSSLQFETLLINKQLLPKDLLKFRIGTNPFLHRDMCVKISKYGEFANLKGILYAHTEDLRRSVNRVTIGYFIPFFKLILQSIAFHDHRPSLRSLFQPLVRQN